MCRRWDRHGSVKPSSDRSGLRCVAYLPRSRKDLERYGLPLPGSAEQDLLSAVAGVRERAFPDSIDALARSLLRRRHEKSRQREQLPHPASPLGDHLEFGSHGCSPIARPAAGLHEPFLELAKDRRPIITTELVVEGMSRAPPKWSADIRTLVTRVTHTQRVGLRRERPRRAFTAATTVSSVWAQQPLDLLTGKDLIHRSRRSAHWRNASRTSAACPVLKGCASGRLRPPALAATRSSRSRSWRMGTAITRSRSPFGSPRGPSARLHQCQDHPRVPSFRGGFTVVRARFKPGRGPSGHSASVRVRLGPSGG